MSYAVVYASTGPVARAGGWLLLSLTLHALLMVWPVAYEPPAQPQPLRITVRHASPPPLPETHSTLTAPPTARVEPPVKRAKAHQSTPEPKISTPEAAETESPVITRESIRSAIQAQQRAPLKRQDDLPAALKAEPESVPQTRLAKEIERSRRKDCRNAYAGAGLLALPILLKDTVTDSGCTW